MKVKIISAGSIGNHLAQAARRMDWDVSVVDIDQKALKRMKKEIYPARYGKWDENIKLYLSGQEPKGGFDIIMIGTPPDVRMQLALNALSEKPKLLHLEKPLCTPYLEHMDEFQWKMEDNPNTIVTVGYDHAVSESIEFVLALLSNKDIGGIISLDVEFREHWQGIFNAHPWLKGPEDTYLGYWRRGGGAGCEHSHALHLFITFINAINSGKIVEKNSHLDFEKKGIAEYDRFASFIFKTEKNIFGQVIQDVVTCPTRKYARIQGVKGYIEWICGVPEGDKVRYFAKTGNATEKIFKKTRPDDFYRLTLHYQDLLTKKIKVENSPLNFNSGLEVIKILNQAYLNH